MATTALAPNALPGPPRTFSPKAITGGGVNVGQPRSIMHRRTLLIESEAEAIDARMLQLLQEDEEILILG